MADDNPEIADVQDVPSINDQDRDIRWAKTGVLFFGGLGVIGILISAFQYVLQGRPGQVCGIIGSGLLIACASFGIGSLLGFIFAIPRALQSQRSTDQSNHEGRTELTGLSRPVLEYQVNTNLEQISDWLTKILVGVGLVQLGKVPEYARRLGSYYSSCLGNAPCSPPLAVTIITVFLVNGFLAGYLITRLYVTGALKRAETEKTVVGPPSSIDFQTKEIELPKG
jgi:hypothetical protein